MNTIKRNARKKHMTKDKKRRVIIRKDEGVALIQLEDDDE